MASRMGWVVAPPRVIPPRFPAQKRIRLQEDQDDEEAADEKEKADDKADEKAEKAADEKAADEKAEKAADVKVADEKAADEKAADEKAADVKAADEEAEADLMIWDSVMGSMTECHKAAMESLLNELQATKKIMAMKDASHMVSIRAERAAMKMLAEMRSELRSVRVEMVAMRSELRSVKAEMKAMQDERRP